MRTIIGVLAVLFLFEKYPELEVELAISFGIGFALFLCVLQDMYEIKMKKKGK